MLIGVAGMVGVGKSTLTRALAARFGLQYALESVEDEDNPWLERFYASPQGQRAYALPLQLHFLATRFESLRLIRARGGSWILDRTWYEDAEIFARGLYEDGLMSTLEHELYQRLYTELLYAPAAKPPRLLVYLEGPLETILARVRSRGRESEREVDEDYWRRLHARYDRWIESFRRCPLLRLDVRAYDLFGDPRAIDQVAGMVRERLDGHVPQTELWPWRTAARAD